MVSVRRHVHDLAAPLAQPDFRRIWLAQTLSEVGDYAARLALATLVYKDTHSATLSAATFAISLLPWVGPGQLLATLADRFGRRAVMVTCDLVRAALYAVLCLSLPVPAVLVVAFLAGLAIPPFASARSAVLPEIVPADRIGAAYRLISITQEVAIVAGSLAGGAVLVWLSPTGALGLNAATFLLSAVLLSGVSVRRTAATAPTDQLHEPPPEPSEPVAGATAEPTADPGESLTSAARLRAAAAFLWRTPPVRWATLLGNLAVGGGTAVTALTVPAVAEEFSVGWAAGAVLAAASVVAALTSAAIPVDGSHARLLRSSAVTAAVSAVLAGALLLVPTAWTAAAGLAVVGGVFAALIPAQSIIGPALPARLRASAFSLLMGTLAGVQVVLVSGSGLLADAIGPARAAGCVCLLVVALTGWIAVPARRSRPAEEESEVCPTQLVEAGRGAVEPS